MYDMSSASLADRVGDMEFLADGEDDEGPIRRDSAYDHSSSSHIASSSSRAQNVDRGSFPSTSEKGKERRRFPEEEEEDLLRETNDRFVLFPIKYREVSLELYCSALWLTSQIWEAYKASQACFWTAEEIDLSHDLHDWEDRLTPNERFFILRTSKSTHSRVLRLIEQASWLSSQHLTGLWARTSSHNSAWTSRRPKLGHSTPSRA